MAREPRKMCSTALVGHFIEAGVGPTFQVIAVLIKDLIKAGMDSLPEFGASVTSRAWGRILKVRRTEPAFQPVVSGRTNGTEFHRDSYAPVIQQMPALGPCDGGLRYPL